MFFLFFLGLAIGSFLNVAILRYNPEKKYSLKTVGGRSHCLYCEKKLSWYELIPVISFVIQLGKCRGCKKRISPQYPIVELLSGIIFVSVPLIMEKYVFFFGGGFPYMTEIFSAVWIIVGLMLIAVFCIDLRYYVIPNYLNFALFCVGVIWTALIAYVAHGSLSGGSFLGGYGDIFSWWSLPIWANHILGSAIATLFFFLIVFVTRGRGMGMGDVKLIGALGMLFGWSDIGAIIMLSFIIGTICAIPLMVRKVKHMKDQVPFGPFIVIATVLIFVWGGCIVKGYFDIIQGAAIQLW